MPAFLILLPLALTSLLIGTLIASSPQTREYVQFIADMSVDPAVRTRLALQIIVHLVAYAVLCFVLVATVHTVSPPLSLERHTLLRRFQFLLELIFVVLPSALLAWLILNAISDGKILAAIAEGDFATALPLRKSDWILWFSLAVALLGLIATVMVCASGVRLVLFRSKLRPFSLTLADGLGVISIAVILATFVFLLGGFMLNSVAGAQFLGAFPVLFLAFATTFLVIAAIFGGTSAPIPVLSAIVSLVLLLQIVDMVALPTRQFRYTQDIPKADTAQPREAAGKQASAPAADQTGDMLGRRGILDLDAAFKQWLTHRRPVIEAYRQEKRAYPLFIVAAQGGGFYAAYHSALSLARLQDACPEFADHVFAISSVSGGSLGAAVFTELLRGQPPRATPPALAPAAASPPQAAASAPPATGQPPATTGGLPALAADPQAATPTAPPKRFCTHDAAGAKLEGHVRKFFQSDLMSPVVASALMFDIPGLLFPPLRWGRDRAVVFELSLEAAWRDLHLGAAAGFSNNFYGRWKPQEPVPALFMSSTGVNHGIPVLVSQVYWQEHTRTAPPRSIDLWRIKRYKDQYGAANPVIQNLLNRIQEGGEHTAGSGLLRIANILDFRPDLQLPVSTAAILSARFPYVTPPGNIRKNDEVKRPSGLYRGMEVMELTDGGFYDNSGRLVAAEVVARLEKLLDDPALVDLKPDIRVRLIHFTHQPAKRTGTGHERSHFELISPLAAFDAVRVERGAQLRGTTPTQYMYLFDGKFDAPLSWLLSDDTKRRIELRSGGEYDEAKDGLCCYVRTPFWSQARLAYLDDKLEKELGAAPRVRLRRFIPNETSYKAIIRLVDEGIRPPEPTPAK